jgi:hypothetical protein
MKIKKGKYPELIFGSDIEFISLVSRYGYLKYRNGDKIPIKLLTPREHLRHYKSVERRCSKIAQEG